jgi:hypothetical protein
LGRVIHMRAADVKLVRRRTDSVTQLGFAIQLATVRAIGMYALGGGELDLSTVPARRVAAFDPLRATPTRDGPRYGPWRRCPKLENPWRA